MFRIFIKKKLADGKRKDQKKQVITRESKRRNRRIYERYNVDQKHLTLLNEQDILVIREISLKGFSSDVSDRAFQRFKVDDRYEGRMRYMGETHDLAMRVSWKKDRVIGFQILETSREGTAFLNRLVKPVALAHSLREVNSDYLIEAHANKAWLRGDMNSDLFIWYGEGGRIDHWRMTWDHYFVEYDRYDGFHTGLIKYKTIGNETSIAMKPEIIQVRDETPNEALKIFSYDVITTMVSRHRTSLMETIERL